MDVSTAIGGAIATTKTLVGLTRVAASAAVDHQVKERIIEVQQGILDLQGQLGDAQAERLQLLNEVHELRERLRAAEAVRAKLESYELCEARPGVMVYKARPESGHQVEHFACPTCFRDGKVSPLQTEQTGRQQITFRCGACKFYRSAGPSDPIDYAGIARRLNGP